jgi:hypothetical protein
VYSTCECSRVWESSAKFQDNSFVVNHNAVYTWIYIGGKGFEKYRDFSDELGIGHINKPFFTTQDILAEIVTIEGERYYY